MKVIAQAITDGDCHRFTWRPGDDEVLEDAAQAFLQVVGYEGFPHRFSAASRAIRLRSSGVSFAALALPPLEPPSRPNA